MRAPLKTALASWAPSINIIIIIIIIIKIKQIMHLRRSYPRPLTSFYWDELFEDLDVDDEKYNPYLTSKEDEDEGGSRDEKESGKWGW